MNRAGAPQGAALKGETILCLAPDPWAGLWRNRHQIMTRLAANNTVVYVEPRLYLGEALRRVRAGQTGLADLRRPPLRQDTSGVWVYRDPVYAPYAGRLSGGPLTAVLRRRAMKAALAEMGAAQPILWLLRPFQADQIGHYGEKLVVYQVVDEYSGHPRIADKAAFRAAEEALLRRAGVVIVTSPALLAAKGRFNPNTHLVRNAVDYAGFRAALARGQRLPSLADTAAGGPHPSIGYVGALNEKVDYRLLRTLAEARPDWRLILVGDLDLAAPDVDAEALRTLPNVRWLGRVPVGDVPLAIDSLDVCLLPYRQNPWTEHIDSLKLYEYLACGKPVVSTDVPAVDDFRPLVNVASDAPGFIAQVQAALGELASPRAAAACAARQAAAAENTWEHRVQQIEHLLADALERQAHA